MSCSSGGHGKSVAPFERRPSGDVPVPTAEQYGSLRVRSRMDGCCRPRSVATGHSARAARSHRPRRSSSMTIHIAGHDGTDRGSDAMALARRLALLHEAQLLAVHVLAVPSIRQHLTGRTVEDLEQDAGVALSRARAESSDVPGPPPRTVYAASPAAGLCEACEDEAAALVTVGSSRHGLVGGVLAGSTAERLLTGSPCAVALAPVGYARVDAPFRRVVVGYDGGPESATAVDVAADIAARAGTGLKVVTVVEILGYDEAEDLAREGAQR